MGEELVEGCLWRVMVGCRSVDALCKERALGYWEGLYKQSRINLMV